MHTITPRFDTLAEHGEGLTQPLAGQILHVQTNGVGQLQHRYKTSKNHA